MNSETSEYALVYGLPGTQEVAVENVGYRTSDDTKLAMDAFGPHDFGSDALLSDLTFVCGYPDAVATQKHE